MSAVIDEAEYQRGRELFAAGATLRQLVEPVLDNHERPGADDDVKAMSRVLGFADGLLALLRVGAIASASPLVRFDPQGPRDA